MSSLRHCVAHRMVPLLPAHWRRPAILKSRSPSRSMLPTATVQSSAIVAPETFPLSSVLECYIIHSKDLAYQCRPQMGCKRTCASDVRLSHCRQTTLNPKGWHVPLAQATKAAGKRGVLQICKDRRYWLLPVAGVIMLGLLSLSGFWECVTSEEVHKLYICLNHLSRLY